MTAKTIKLLDDGKTYYIGNEDGFQQLLESLKTPCLFHLETKECVSKFESLVAGGTYKTKQHPVGSVSNKFDDGKAAFINRLKKVVHQLECDSQYDRAKVALELILSDQKKLFGGDLHPDIVQTHVHMATLAGLQGDFASGMESYRQALLVALKLFGREHPVVAGIYTAGGHFMTHLGRPVDAYKMYQCSLQIHSKLSGDQKQSVPVAEGFVDCGRALEQLGEYKSALGCHQEAMSILVASGTTQKNCNGSSDHLCKIAQIQCHIASNLNHLGFYTGAKHHYQAAHSIHQGLCAESNSSSGSDSSTKSETGRGASPVVS